MKNGCSCVHCPSSAQQARRIAGLRSSQVPCPPAACPHLGYAAPPSRWTRERRRAGDVDAEDRQTPWTAGLVSSLPRLRLPEARSSALFRQPHTPTSRPRPRAEQMLSAWSWQEWMDLIWLCLPGTATPHPRPQFPSPTCQPPGSWVPDGKLSPSQLNCFHFPLWTEACLNDLNFPAFQRQFVGGLFPRTFSSVPLLG